MNNYTQSKKPRSGGTASAAAAGFEEGAPPTHFNAARAAYYESVGQPAVDRARLFVVTVLSMVLAISCVAAMFVMLPLKTVQPYVAVVNSETGQVGRALGDVKQAGEYEPGRAVIERELFEFVRRVYAINADYPKVARDAHYSAFAYTRGRASQEFKDFMDKEQPYQRQTTTKGLIRTVERRTISFQGDGKLVLIRFRTSERSEDRPVPIVRDHLMTVQFLREQPTEQEELEKNPLGIYISHFEITEERQ